MMKLYICPDCRHLVLVSRRANVSCPKCDRKGLPAAKLTFLEYSEMSEEDRQAYADQWSRKESKIE